ncbi:MAG: LysR family transcriptional regulator [Pseudomonadota bacterium]
MDTDALRLFVLAADQRNISAAGRKLGMAPAVASAKLAKLEKLLATDLLHRSTRKVALSVEGAEFLPYAREILAQEDAGLAALGHDTHQAKGTLRFTAPSSFTQLYIAPLLAEFLNTQTGIKLDLRLSDTRFDLIDGSYDLALRNAPLQDTSLKGRKLTDDTRVLCAAPSYLEKHGTPQTPDDLANHQLIGFQGDSARLLRSTDGHSAVFDPSTGKSRLFIDDGTSQRIATIAGAGVSLNSRWIVHDDIKSGRLVRVLPHFSSAESSALWLIYPKANVLSAKVRVFIDFLIDRIGRNPPWEQPVT